MNELVVPPAPHWYKSSVMTCSPDNTLIYGAKNDIVIITEKTPEKPVKVRIIHGAHTKHIISVSLNKKWKDPNSYVASVGEDNVIKIWDLDTLEKKTVNKDHTEHKDPVIGAIFAGDDRIVSASSHGHVIVWNINTNESRPLNDLFKSKVTLTCLSSCPHAVWLLAFGLSNGCVVVADVRRNGHTLYRLRGHYDSVVALSWCPAPVNIFPRYVNNKVKNKSQKVDMNTTKTDQSSGDKTLDIDEKGFNDSVVTKVKVKKVNPWINLKHADDDEIGSEDNDTKDGETRDYLKECDDLKNVILGLDDIKQNTTDSQNGDVEVEEIKSEIETEKYRGPEIIEGRPFPKLFDPSGDFLDDSGFDDKIAMKEFLKKNDTEEAEDFDKSPCIEKDNSKYDDCKSEKNETDMSDVKSEEQTLDVPTVGNEKNQIQEPGVEDVTNEEKCSTEINAEAIKEEEKIVETTKEEQKIVEATNEEEKIVEATKEEEKIVEATKQEEIVEEEPRTDYLLASSGKDKSIYIWRAGTDGRMQTYFYTSKKMGRKDKTPNSWISLCWVTPDTILTSSPNGQVLAWPIPKPRDSDKQHKVVHLEHSSTVFNIVTPPKYSTAFNWKDKVDTHIWSWGQEGKLVNFDLNNKKLRYSYATISAGITCFGSSPLDPNRLAIGLRDGGIRVWDLSLPHTNVVSMQKHQYKITHKVSAIAWHPQREMVVGFGTEEGRVGFFDLTSKKNKLFPHYFQSHVYKVEWGPIRGDTENLGLYVVSEGKIAIYDMNKPDEDPWHLELPTKFYVYKFAWKPDFTLLLLNGKDGSLVVLNVILVAVATIYPNDKGLNCIVWHPDSFTDKTDISPRCNWVAATTSKGVIVFDCTSIQENDNFADKIVATLEGHLRPPLALAWCPFEGNRIVSTAADGLSHVWDVVTKTVIATFVDLYLSHNVAVAWSPVEPDLIIMGDKVLRVWSISKNPPKIDEEFMATRKRLLSKAPKTETEKVDKNKIKVNIPLKSKSNPRNCIVPAFYVANDENIASQVENMRKLLDGTEIPTEDKFVDSLRIFGSKEQVTHLLDTNYVQQSKEGKYKSCEMISLWKGNVGEYIQNAINENRVTPSVINLAPMVSPKLWQDACLTYAKKLSEDPNSDPLDTAMYFLVCHKVEEAIDCLCLNLMFKEALALAKHRLPEGSEMITKVVEQWAEHCKNTGNFENAAYCYISIKDYEDAAKVLSRRNHKEFLEFALELAEKAENKGLCDSIKYKYSELQNTGSEDINELVDKNVPSRVDALLQNMTDGDKSVSNSQVEDESQAELGFEILNADKCDGASEECESHKEVEM